jgi:hypothetical protein
MIFPEGWVVQQIPNFLLHTDLFSQEIPTYVVVDSTRQDQPAVGSLVISRRKMKNHEMEFIEPRPSQREFRRQWSLGLSQVSRQTGAFVEFTGPSRAVIKFSLLDLNNDILSEAEFKVDRQRKELEELFTHIFQYEDDEWVDNEIWCVCFIIPDWSTDAYIDILPEGSTLIAPPPDEDERWRGLMDAFGFSEEE